MTRKVCLGNCLQAQADELMFQNLTDLFHFSLLIMPLFKNKETNNIFPTSPNWTSFIIVRNVPSFVYYMSIYCWYEHKMNSQCRSNKQRKWLNGILNTLLWELYNWRIFQFLNATDDSRLTPHPPPPPFSGKIFLDQDF